MTWKLFGAVLFLVAVALATAWLLRETELQSLQAERPKTHVPDYYFTDATVTNLDMDGRLASDLVSPRIIHHPDDDSVETFQPKMRYFIKNGPPWYAVADHGMEPSGDRLVYLDGNVVLTHPDQAGGPPLVVSTQHLTVDLTTNVASTDDPVSVQKGTSQSHGIGMEGYLRDNRLVLKAKVTGLYVPKKP